jgi:hypothetical protein
MEIIGKPIFNEKMIGVKSRMKKGAFQFTALP